MHFDARTAKLLKAGESMSVEGCPGLRLRGGAKAKTWFYRFKAGDKLQQVSLGYWPDMSVQDAVSAWNDARRKKESGTPLQQEFREARAAIKAVQAPVLAIDDQYRVRQLVQHYIDGHLNGARKNEGALASERALLRVLESDPIFANTPAKDVTRQMAFGILESRKDRPTAAQKLRSMFGAAWDYALDAGRLEGDTPNWWRLVMKGRLKSKGKLIGGQHVGKKRRSLADDEVGRLLAWLPQMHELGADVVKMYLHTGARGVEILSMEGRHIAEKDGVLWWTIPKALTKNARFDEAVDLRVPLFGMAREVVERRLADAESGAKLFLGADGEPYTQHDFSTYIYDLQPYSPKSQRAGRRREVLPVTDWTPHCLRRTARTMLAALGCPDEIGEVIVGHMPTEIKATYNAYSYDAERAAWLTKLSHKLGELAVLGLPARP